MNYALALLYAALCGGTVLFQAGLIAGLPWGYLTQGGQHIGSLPMSGKIIAGLSIPVLFLFAYSVLSLAKLVPLWPVWTGWVTFGLQGVSMMLNWITPSRPERYLWGPITTLMFMLVLISLLSLDRSAEPSAES